MGNLRTFGLAAAACVAAGVATMTCHDGKSYSETELMSLPISKPRLVSGDLGSRTCKERYNASVSYAISAAHAMRRGERFFDDSVMHRVETKLRDKTQLVRYLEADPSIVESPSSFPERSRVDINRIVSFDDRIHGIDKSDALACRSPSAVAMERSFGVVPEGLAILHYKMRAESLLMGLSVGNDFYSAEVLLPASDIAALASNWVYLLTHGRSSSTAHQKYAEALFRIFIEPMQAEIASASTIALIPDRFMRYIPFAGLRDPSTGQAVVSDYAVVVLPSPNVVYLASNQQRSTPSLDYLGVGGVVVDREQFPSLNSLPSSVSEIDSSARFYVRRRTLLGEEASADEFCAHADVSRIVHVATHSVADDSSPLRSKMLFTHAGGESFLSALQLSSCRFSAADLVILATCDSSLWYWERTRGYAWVTPLHTVGVPSVLASLWAVEDTASARFLTVFHEEYSSGISAAQALQRAQIREIQHEADAGSPHRQGMPVWLTYQLLIGSLVEEVGPGLSGTPEVPLGEWE